MPADNSPYVKPSPAREQEMQEVVDRLVDADTDEEDDKREWVRPRPPTGGTVELAPAFEGCPTATEIARWFSEEMRGVGNIGGDAWWLSRSPHGSCRMLAFVDFDTQEHYLLDIATEDTKDLLWVTYGLDGLWCDWWQHPVPTSNGDPYWHHDGIRWLADKVVWFIENPPTAQTGRGTNLSAGRADKTSTSDGATTRQLPQAIQPTPPGPQTGRRGDDG